MKVLTRKITKQEVKIANRSHLKVFLFVPICLLIGFVVYSFNIHPYAKIAAYILLPLILLIFFKSQIQIAKEVNKGEVLVYEGVVIQKILMGNKSNRTRGSYSGSRTKTYFIKLDEKKLRVSVRVYKKAKVGMHVQISVLEKSEYVMDLVECGG